ncbi:ABC transporter substrate-binding protein [Undibacterium sp. WLHG33]|uniref:ABC transporter substrate-binding protein n=1 Tax=Undibacterium sp. WLHG33 TaxID=3412482 RepID=UPI003C2C5AC7
MRFWHLLVSADWRRTWLVGLFGAALMLFSGMSASAYTLESITVVLSDEGGAYEEFASHFNSLLQPANKTSVKLVSLKNVANDDFTRTNNNQLVIAVGTPAMVAMAQKPASNAVLNVLVPRATFIKTAKQYNRSQDHRRFSAVYMDQSWTRQLRLIRTTMPTKPKVGILLGKESSEHIASLQSAAKEADVTLNIETVNDDADLLNALRRLLSSSNVILAVPDTQIYNRNNISSILLTSYRQQVPLFGFSASYVKAGALAAVYSSPAQIGQQVAEIISNLSSASSLPAPQYPRYFSVNTNPQVARSLGLSIDSESEIQRHLRQLSELAQ